MERGDRVNIVLCCAAGMSTSLLVEKMKAAAKELCPEAEIVAVPEAEIMHYIDAAEEKDKADVILLGPQVRYKLQNLKRAGEEKGIPVAVIAPVDYGMINGKKVLECALDLMK